MFLQRVVRMIAYPFEVRFPQLIVGFLLVNMILMELCKFSHPRLKFLIYGVNANITINMVPAARLQIITEPSFA